MEVSLFLAKLFAVFGSAFLFGLVLWVVGICFGNVPVDSKSHRLFLGCHVIQTLGLPHQLRRFTAAGAKIR